MVLGQISRKLNKGKALLAIHDGHGDKQVMVCIRCYLLFDIIFSNF